MLSVFVFRGRHPRSDVHLAALDSRSELCPVLSATIPFLTNEPDLFPIEIKAGMTFTRNYFKGLNHFAKLFPDSIPNGSGLVYGGEAEQQRSNVSIVPVQSLHRLFN